MSPAAPRASRTCGCPWPGGRTPAWYPAPPRLHRGWDQVCSVGPSIAGPTLQICFGHYRSIRKDIFVTSLLRNTVFKPQQQLPCPTFGSELEKATCKSTASSCACTAAHAVLLQHPSPTECQRELGSIRISPILCTGGVGTRAGSRVPSAPSLYQPSGTGLLPPGCHATSQHSSTRASCHHPDEQCRRPLFPGTQHPLQRPGASRHFGGLYSPPNLSSIERNMVWGNISPSCLTRAANGKVQS